jgi:hypothetical protein
MSISAYELRPLAYEVMPLLTDCPSIKTSIRRNRDWGFCVRAESFEVVVGAPPIHRKWDIDLIPSKKTGCFTLRVDGFGFVCSYQEELLEELSDRLHYENLFGPNRGHSPNLLGEDHWQAAISLALDELTDLVESGELEEVGHAKLTKSCKRKLKAEPANGQEAGS